MEMILKRKYRVQPRCKSIGAKARTSGRTKFRKKNGKTNHVQYYMLVDAGTGKRRMVQGVI